MNKIKEWFRRYRKVILGFVAVTVLLVWAFWYGGNAPGARGFSQKSTSETSGQENVGDGKSGSEENEPDAGTGSSTVSDTDDEDSEKSSNEGESEAGKLSDDTASAGVEKGKAGNGDSSETYDVVTSGDSEADDADNNGSGSDTGNSNADKNSSESGATGNSSTDKNGSGSSESGSTGKNSSGSSGNGNSSTGNNSSGSSESGNNNGSGNSNTGNNSSGSSGSGNNSGNSSTDKNSSGNSGSGSTDKNSSTGNDSTGSDGSSGNEGKYTCHISISCKTVLGNMDMLTSGKEKYVPQNGVVLAEVSVSFEEGDTVFDVLKKVCKNKGIQLEYSYTPVYGSYYIEGINNLYEFDCGNLSGWMYSVNGTFPNYGCSQYQLSDGDVIKWLYTCDLGTDVGHGMN